MDKICDKVWYNHGWNEYPITEYGSFKITKSDVGNAIFRVSVVFNFGNSFSSVREISFNSDKNKWTLKIFPDGFCFGSKFISLGLCLTECPSSVPQWVFLHNPNDDSFYEQKFICGDIWGITKYKEKVNPPLTLNFYIFDQNHIKRINFKNYDAGLEKSINNELLVNNVFDSDLTDILYSKDRDITLYGDNWELKAHKEVLTARSPVFAAMFDSSMTESQTNSIQITDIEPHVIRALLNYMYSGKPSLGIDDILPQLYLASSKYQIDKLTSYCEHGLCVDINANNVFERVKVADLMQSDLISNACSEFLLDNFNQVLGHEEWKKFEENNKSMCVLLTKLLKSDQL